MSIVKKRNWKTVELNEGDIAEFAKIGGLELEVLSDADDHYPNSGGKQVSPDKPKKKKKKNKSSNPVVPVSTPSNDDVKEGNRNVEPSGTIDMEEWSEYDLNSKIIEGLSKLGFSKPSPIQAAVMSKSMEGMDILGAAQTGSGKTLAFGLPILHSILGSVGSDPSTKALCILPTRELAIQVKEHLVAVVGSSASIGVVVGGMSIDKQRRVLNQKPDIVVGTPGRLAGVLGISKNNEAGQLVQSFKDELASNLRFLVLDEADRLLEQSHFRDLTSVLEFLYESIPNTAAIQSFIFSATLPVDSAGELNKLLRKLRLKPPQMRHVVDLVANNESGQTSVPTKLSFHTMMATSDQDREPFLMYYLYKERMQSNKRSIVFVNAISYVYRLASLLPLCFPGCKVVGIHSNLRQKDRLKKLDQFKAGDNCIMVATDIAARGLDLPQVDSVVHLQPPRTPESLIHRSGRTARANRAGSCVMIITPTQVSEWKKSVRIALNKDVEEVDVLDVVSIDIRRIREIQRVANEIEGKTHKEKRESKDRAWTKKACEEADLWDSDASVSENDEFSDDKFDGVKRSNSGANPPRLSELEVLLKEPLPSLRK